MSSRAKTERNSRRAAVGGLTRLIERVKCLSSFRKSGHAEPKDTARPIGRICFGTSRLRCGQSRRCPLDHHTGCTPKRLPYKSPNLNPYAESWVGTLRRECLDHFAVLGEKHLRYLIGEYVGYYNTVRPHGSIGGPLGPLAMPAAGQVHCDERLGGLLKHYYRKAA